jgi:predicted GNAT family acetyltransferase
MSDEIDIHREETSGGGRYVTVVDGHEAELTYAKQAADRIVIDHTGVPRALGGRGVGQALVRRVVEEALANGVKIVPACSFAAAQIEKHPEWRDVLAG